MVERVCGVCVECVCGGVCVWWSVSCGCVKFAMYMLSECVL